MTLWTELLNILGELRVAFSRNQTFLWFCTVVIGFCTRVDNAGVTSFIRGLQLHERCYGSLLEFFQSRAVDLEKLTATWVKIVLRRFPLVKIKGFGVVLVDGIKVGKEGRKMPGVKSLHQESQSNTKPEFIMGHFIQQASILVGTPTTALAVPLIARIHDGLVRSNRDSKTVIDRLLGMLAKANITEQYYLVADAYYAAGSIVQHLQGCGNHFIVRVRSSSVGYVPAEPTQQKSRGRPRLYGSKVWFKRLFADRKDFVTAMSTAYKEQNQEIQYLVKDLFWRPAKRLMRFVLVDHPSRGKIILMCSDLNLEPLEILRAYSLRFKIEVGFKSAVHSVGAFLYHFWSAKMTKITRGSGNQYLHRESAEYRERMMAKMDSYNLFIQTGLIAQGILQHLSLTQTKLVWRKFGSWLRTIRPNVAPSEAVVKIALKNTYLHFLSSTQIVHEVQKFLRERVAPDRDSDDRMAA
jgi:hypothetical protein